MTDIQASLGLIQLRRLDAMQAHRHQIVARYNAAFNAMPELQAPAARPNVESSWHLYPLRLNLDRLTIDRARFIEELKARNIGSSVHFIPVHMHPYYRDKYGWQPDSFPITFHEYKRVLSLPLYSRLSDADVDDVIAAVQDIVQQHRA